MADRTFGEETAVEPVPDVPGRYRAESTASWAGPVHPQGGMAIIQAVRAAIAEVATPEQSLRTLTTAFAGAVPVGRVDIDVEILRRGRSATQVLVRLRPVRSDDPGHVTTMTFGRDRSHDHDFVELAMPDVVAPDDAPAFPEPPEEFEKWDPPPFFQRLEDRWLGGRLPWTDDGPGPARFRRWMKYREAPLDAGGGLDPLSVIPVLDLMPSALGQGMPTLDRSWFAPSLDFTAHFFEPDLDGEWMLQDIVCHRFSGGYASAEMALWDPGGRLLAWANQMMVVTFLE